MNPVTRIIRSVPPHRSFIPLLYLLYNCIVAVVALPLVLLYLLYRGIKDRRYWHHLSERFGMLDTTFHRTVAGSVWLHAVSVGEIISAIQLVKEWRAVLPPELKIYVSTTTLAGRAMAEQKLAGVADGVFFAPIDFQFAVRRVLNRIKPALVVVMETEIWPNLYRESKRSGASLAVVNGRISDRTVGRYRRMSWFFRAALAQPDRILAQSRQDATRYLQLGAPPDRVVDAGNLKFDFNPAASPIPLDIAAFLDESCAGARIWIAASTMPPADEADPDEDEVVIAAFERLSNAHPNLLLILVPRRPERFDLAATRLAAAGVRFTRRTALEPIALPGVLLLDSMGELGSLFIKGDVVFMGGTLPKRGGHNILEPASVSKPVIVGPHMENFAAIATLFREADAMVRIGGPAELEGAVDRLLRDPGACAELGERAARAAASQRGVTRRVAAEMMELHAAGVPRRLHSLPKWLVLWPLSRLWAAFARKPDGARRLTKPVVSIGGITMGGTGKTPMAAWLAEQFKNAGVRPAILTRGYGRRSPSEQVIVPAGHAAPVDLTGDEAQIFVRRGAADLGIGADRFRAGTQLEELFAPDVFLLDDGFQHRKLARDLDLVMIDTLEPFGGGDVFPLGRLREPLDNLARADAFILSRANPGRRTDGIEAVLRRFNPSAPVFRSWVAPSKWRGGTPTGNVAAFCGLANPNTFWKLLDELGLTVQVRWTYPDHHRYSCLEAKRIAYQAKEAGVEYLVTTEKDYVNLPEGAFQEFEREVRLCWLEIAVRFEDPEGLLEYVMNRTIRSVNSEHKFL